MASLKYSTSSAVGSYDVNTIFKLSISIDDITHNGYGGATLYIKVRGHRGDYNGDGLRSVYFEHGSSLSYFNEDTTYIQPVDDQDITDFHVDVTCDSSGNATFDSHSHFTIYGTTSSGKRGIKVTLKTASGLNPWYYVDYYDANGDFYKNDTFYPGKTLKILSSGPVKDNASAGSSNFTITGDGNGGYFTSTTITTDVLNATKIGTYRYTFTSWNTKSDGSGATYDAGKTVTMPNTSLKLYPIYSRTISYKYTNNAISALKKPKKDDTQPLDLQYSVIFNANGGSVSVDSDLVKTNRMWTFSGWATSASANSANASATYEKTTTVYAYWTYRDVKGKTTLPTPTRVGYKFLGWGTSKNQTSNLLAAGATPEISANITYYAIWKADGSVRIYCNDTDKYKIALVWIYYPNGESDLKPWKLAIPYLKTSSDWKITAG